MPAGLALGNRCRSGRTVRLKVVSSREIVEQLDLAVTQPDPIVAIYRQYLSSDLTSGPENDPPLELNLITVTADVFRVRATAGFPNLLNRKFPGLTYDLDTFPGLAQ